MGRTFKNPNFWTKILDANNTNAKEVSATLGVDRSTVLCWLCGKYMPSEQRVKDLCELFGVDFSLGHSAFVEIRDNWKKVNLGIVPEPTSVPEPTETTSGVTIVPMPATASSAFAEIAKYIYGKVSFEEYESLRQNITGSGDPMALLYGKIPFEEYMKLMGMVKDNAV
jgi:transcriptional regulator with XRE-family HTH domain